ncbi:TetR/AcrR family transcriptional regulator [Cystobacter fuscus]|uniref:TetR/AcrR family transcriptional regulator n=1 Tax=Cystobacter fuscus TaxID=43 RepID=UPI0037BE2231
MSKNQREALLEAGMELVHARGFGATGVREITQAAGVPQGSFTNHFRSKEGFGVLILDRYEQKLDGIMNETLGNEALSPADRLRAYFAHISRTTAEAGWQRGCIVPDLAAEIAVHGDALRERLCAVLEHQSARFEEVVRLLRPDDEAAASDLGAFLLAAWYGTLLRMKVERNPAAVERFRRMLEGFLQPPPRK